MKSVNVYLHFADKCEEIFTFYQSVFGGKFSILHRYGDTPMGDKLSASDRNKIVHVSLPLANGSILMGSDCCASMGPPIKIGNNFSISMESESPEEVDTFHKALSSGGTITMPAQKTFWGAYFAMCIDRFGVQWMMSYTYPK
jgi:PhnB protein